MPVPNHELATTLMTEYTYHGQENRLETYGLEPPGPYEILLKASLQARACAEVAFDVRLLCASWRVHVLQLACDAAYTTATSPHGLQAKGGVAS